MKKNPLISIVIPAYNEEKCIDTCLRALLNQGISQSTYEIIVVDNNSTDATARIALNHHVRVITEKQKGNVYALRTGVKESKGSIVLLTDADTIVPQTWMSDYRVFFEKNPHAVAASGPFIFMDGPWLIKKAVMVLNKIIPPIWGTSTLGVNMGFLRTAYDEVGGFDTHVNLQSDFFLGFTLKRLGTVGYLDHTVVFTSARRFAKMSRIPKEICIRTINRFSLTVRKKPFVFAFEDIR